MSAALVVVHALLVFAAILMVLRQVVLTAFVLIAAGRGQRVTVHWQFHSHMVLTAAVITGAALT